MDSYLFDIVRPFFHTARRLCRSSQRTEEEKEIAKEERELFCSTFVEHVFGVDSDLETNEELKENAKTSCPHFSNKPRTICILCRIRIFEIRVRKEKNLREQVSLNFFQNESSLLFTFLLIFRLSKM